MPDEVYPNYPEPVTRHTKALTYSRWETLVFNVTGRWPQRVVDRRLLAMDLDQRESEIVTLKWIAERRDG